MVMALNENVDHTEWHQTVCVATKCLEPSDVEVCGSPT